MAKRIPTIQELKRYYRNQHKILREVKKTLNDGEVIHGRYNLNAQLKPKYLRSHTDDIDAYSKNAKQEAIESAKALNKKFGGKYFYVTKGQHKGTYKVKSRITGKTKLDITKPKGKIPYVVINGIRYQKLSAERKHTKKTIKSGKAKFREAKDKDKLYRMRVHNLQKARRIKARKQKTRARPKVKRRTGGINLW